jgi:chemotaxis protein MotB
VNGMEEKKSLFHKNPYRDLIASSLEKAEEDHNWLITLSDLLSLLLVFFIVFFALSRVPTKKKEAPDYMKPALKVSGPVSVSNPNRGLEKIRNDMQTTVTGLGLGDQVVIHSGAQEILISLKENITFPLGEAEILKSSEPVLDTIAQMVRRYPSFQVEIDGHTDDQPINTKRFPSNWELSVARATSVLKYLIVRQGLDPARFTIKGNGEQHPLTANNTPEQRAQNRRVEIRLKDQSDLNR